MLYPYDLCRANCACAQVSRKLRIFCLASCRLISTSGSSCWDISVWSTSRGRPYARSSSFSIAINRTRSSGLSKSSMSRAIARGAASLASAWISVNFADLPDGLPDSPLRKGLNFPRPCDGTTAALLSALCIATSGLLSRKDIVPTEAAKQDHPSDHTAAQTRKVRFEWAHSPLPADETEPNFYLRQRANEDCSRPLRAGGVPYAVMGETDHAG
jgi:hypothetical protein